MRWRADRGRAILVGLLWEHVWTPHPYLQGHQLARHLVTWTPGHRVSPGHLDTWTLRPIIFTDQHLINFML